MSDYYDLGAYSRPIRTASPEAQMWFDRGLNWCFGFHHEEAIYCFEKSLEADPECAMAQWGIAYAAGPNYNMPWELYDPDGKAVALSRAFDAAAAASRLAGRVTSPERVLIEALSARYPQRDTVDDQSPWNDAFTSAMREAYSLHPQDLDIRTIFVDAIMNRTPWKMWDLKTGKVAEGADTLEARDVLETAFNRIAGAIDHPGLLHLYVHLMEMSPFPERALRVADKLRELVPDAGHLIHMPTHIDMLCGNYHDVLHWNQKAIAVDRKYLERAGPVKFYTGYRIHNYRFAIYGSMFLGQYEPALAAAEELIATTPEKLLRMPSPPMADMLEGYISVKQHVLVRFGKWREIIAEALPDDKELYCNTVATINYAKGVAHAALGEISEAEKEQERFRVARNRVPLTRRIHNNSCQDLLGIAEEMLAGEIEYRKGNYDVAFAHLRKVVELDDSLPYDEPWGWMQPTRHALGALLLEQGLTDEAEVVYREDLGIGGRLSRAQIHPDNLWSLQGLFDCLVRRGEKAESRLVRQRLDLAAARADVQARVSCFCARGKVASSD